MTPDVSQRVRTPEIMDQPDLAPERHVRALRGLARLNRWSGAAGGLWRELRSLTEAGSAPLRVLDVACGGGDVAIALARRARHARVRLEVTGCDLSPRALEHARRRAALAGVDVAFMPLDAVGGALPDGFDCVICSLFLHHLARPAAVALLARMGAAARQAVVVSDLRRSRTGLLLAHVATRLLSRSDVVHVDGPRSVRAAFTLDEARGLAADAGLTGARVAHAWPCRFLLSWRRN